MEKRVVAKTSEVIVTLAYKTIDHKYDNILYLNSPGRSRRQRTNRWKTVCRPATTDCKGDI
eukprot:11852598-Ditylum_brightwellii.AAC.1